MKKIFDFPSFTNENVSNFMKFIQENMNIKIISSEVDENLIDISLSRGQNEENFFMSDSNRKNLRRGNSVYQLENFDIVIARKGLQKFFSLEYHTLNANANANEYEEAEKKRSEKFVKRNPIEVRRKIKKSDNSIQNLIFKDVQQAFEDKHEVYNSFFCKNKFKLY